MKCLTKCNSEFITVLSYNIRSQNLILNATLVAKRRTQQVGTSVIRGAVSVLAAPGSTHR